MLIPCGLAGRTRGPAIELPSAVREGGCVYKVWSWLCHPLGSTLRSRKIGEAQKWVGRDLPSSKCETSSYQAVVLGSAIRMGKALVRATEFVRALRPGRTPVAAFTWAPARTETRLRTEKVSAAPRPLRGGCAGQRGFVRSKAELARLELASLALSS